MCFPIVFLTLWTFMTCMSRNSGMLVRNDFEIFTSQFLTTSPSGNIFAKILLQSNPQQNYLFIL